MTIDIIPIVGIVFNLFTFAIGLDFAWSGYLYLKTNKTTHIPKLLGFWVLKLFEVGNRKSKSKNEYAKNMFSMKAAGTYLRVGGLLLMLDGAFRLLARLLW